MGRRRFRIRISFFAVLLAAAVFGSILVGSASAGTFKPRPYAIQTDLGSVTGAQASVVGTR